MSAVIAWPKTIHICTSTES